jgi:OOP family OmpA-OmpF porin
LLALATACSTPVVDKLDKTQPSGSAFNNQLTQEYKLLAKFEADDMQDFIDAGHFAEKGVKASQNGQTEPDGVWSRDIPKAHVVELTTARTTLMEAFDNDARNRYPVPAATAQAKFDCWLEQQEENYQPQHIAACRNAFQTAMGVIESREQARMSSKPQEADRSRAADRIASANTEPASPLAVVYFDFDEAVIEGGELNKIERIAADLRSRKDGYAIIATGHADRVGGYDYNKKLSVERAVAVKDALIDRGVEPSVIVINGKGEMDPAEPTGDGVRERDNRRVHVSIR